MTEPLEHEAQTEEEQAEEGQADTGPPSGRTVADRLYNQVRTELETAYGDDVDWYPAELDVIAQALMRAVAMRVSPEEKHLRERIRVCVREHQLAPKQRTKGVADRLALYTHGVIDGRS